MHFRHADKTIQSLAKGFFVGSLAILELLVTPENNGIVPAVLKNAIDLLLRPRNASPLRDKPVSILVAGPSAQSRSTSSRFRRRGCPRGSGSWSSHQLKTFRGQSPDDANSVREAVTQAWQSLQLAIAGP